MKPDILIRAILFTTNVLSVLLSIAMPLLVRKQSILTYEQFQTFEIDLILEVSELFWCAFILFLYAEYKLVYRCNVHSLAISLFFLFSAIMVCLESQQYFRDGQTGYKYMFFSPLILMWGFWVYLAFMIAVFVIGRLTKLVGQISKSNGF